MLSRLSSSLVHQGTPPTRVNLSHNLPEHPAGFYLVQFLRGVTAPEFLTLVRGSQLSFLKRQIEEFQAYKLIVLKIDNGIAEGLWWYDDYIYNADQVNIEFKSQGAGTATGELKTFSGTVSVLGQPAQRRVIAYGIDGDAPLLLADTMSDALGRYTLEWRGYTGNVLMTALDDYGVAWSAGAAHGNGERIHPAVPNGYVYQVQGSGVLGTTEPQWPTDDGAQLTSGTVQLIALPYYRPLTIGPHFIP